VSMDTTEDGMGPDSGWWDIWRRFDRLTKRKKTNRMQNSTFFADGWITRGGLDWIGVSHIPNVLKTWLPNQRPRDQVQKPLPAHFLLCKFFACEHKTSNINSTRLMKLRPELSALWCPTYFQMQPNPFFKRWPACFDRNIVKCTSCLILFYPQGSDINLLAAEAHWSTRF
jgi:hypothetical protein